MSVVISGEDGKGFIEIGNFVVCCFILGGYWSFLLNIRYKSLVYIGW